MRVLLDENIPPSLGRALAVAGFEVRAIANFAAQSPDEAVLAEAESHAEVLVTADKDFGELVWRRGRAFHG